MSKLNTPGPNDHDNPGSFTFGIRFHTTEPMLLKWVYWQDNGSVGSFPARLAVARRSDDVRIWDTYPLAPVMVALGGDAYRVDVEAEHGGTVPLVSGEEYVVTAYGEGATFRRPYWTGGGGVPDAGLAVDWWSVYQAGDQIDPANLYGSNIRSYLDILAEVPPPPPPPGGEDPDPPTNATISARIAEWLSSNAATNIHELDGLPWLIHALSVAIKEETAETVQLLQALAGYGGAIAFGSSDDKLAAIGGVLQAIWTDAPGGVPRMETAIIDALTGGDAGLAAQLSGATGARFGGDTTGVASPVGWFVSNTIMGVGDVAWEWPADRYVLTITAWGADRRWGAVGGIPYYGHRGFWTPLEVDLVGDYRPIVGRKHLMWVPGARLQGVLVGLEPDLEWTLEAYDWVGV